MLKAIIVDDESRARNMLRILIEKHTPEISKVFSAATALEGIELIRKQNPHIVFLDIEMPFMDGFGLLSEIADRNFEVIFTTAYNQYAIKAIRFSALDYLLKPIEPEELKAAVRRFLQKRELSLDKKKLYRNFIDNLEGIHHKRPRLAIPTQDGVFVFDVPNIIRCEASSNYTLIYLDNQKKVIASKTLKEYDQLLLDYNFCRVHKSHLVNFDYVKAYSHEGFLLLRDDSRVDVSRRKKKEVMQRLKAG